MKSILLTIICLLIPPSSHRYGTKESEDDARARYATIAEAVDKVAGDDQVLAAFLLTVARHESSFRRDIHSGKKRGDGGWSWGLFQIKNGPEPTKFVRGTGKKYRARDIVGVELRPTMAAVEVAAIHLRPKIEACHRHPECVFRSYGGIGPKVKLPPYVAKRIRDRVATFGRIRARQTK